MLKSSILIFFIGIGIIGLVMTLLFLMIKLLSSDVFGPKSERLKAQMPTDVTDQADKLDDSDEVDNSDELDDTTRVLIAAAVFAKIGPKGRIQSIRLRQNANDRQDWIGENLRQGHKKGASPWA